MRGLFYNPYLGIDFLGVQRLLRSLGLLLWDQIILAQMDDKD
jgi:hypothetical protein